MKKIYVALFLFYLLPGLRAQITVTQTSNSQTLSQLLAGSGVTISNYTLTCAANGSGTFTNTNTNLGMPGGVILASGRVQNVPNASNVFASSQFTATGDAQLSTLTTGTIYDPCVLQFDIVPQGPLLKFDYVFASEEYPEWVCSRFNDVFGFFITGPNPGGGNYTNTNIALINGTNLPVAINTINPGMPGANANGGTCNTANQSTSYSSLYTNNQVPVNTNIVYDGMTHLLTATASVVPCQTYRLKIAIADVADRIYDSGVFLSAYSFNANPVSVTAVGNLDYAGFSSAYEGCVGGTFTLTLSQAQVVDVYVNVVVSGTATNGSDYTAIPTTVMIPAGQTSVSIDLNPLEDGIAEGMESVTIATLNPCTGAVSSSATINIRDNTPATITATDTTLCPGQSTQLDANGGITYSWTPTNGLSNPNIKNPVATPSATTTYICNMTFGACTKTVSQTVYVSNPSAAIAASPAGTICNGGTVQMSATAGGVLPYNYLWSTGATTPAVTVSTGGNYTVTTTDAYGCTATATSSLVISNLALTGTSNNVSCVGLNNGAIDITATGANAPFTYNWGGGVVSQDRTNLAAGTYTVTVSNTVGCSASATYTITQPASNLTSTATNTSVSCNGGNNGSINLTPAGGVSPYTFAWSNSAVTEDINSLTAGTYSVTLSDANGCSTTRSVSITQPSAISITETHTNPTCAGGNGSIDVTVSGAISPYSYAWSNGATTQDQSGIAASNYTVTVADANGCTASRTITITQPGNLIATANATTPSCNGSNNGNINLAVTGGSTPYSYIWNNGSTSASVSGLAAGTYTATVTDINGCSVSVSSTLSQPQTMAVTATTSNVNCNGGNNGSITTTVTGGTAPYTYSWNGGVTTANLSNITAGSYFLTVTDSRGCTASLSAVITQPAALTISETHTNAQCNGTSTGAIDVTVSGGSPAYTYAWADGATTQDRNNLAAGTYRITATDNRGCTVSATAVISQPAAVGVSLNATNPTCNGAATGSITTTVTGGTAPYNYNWSNGATSGSISGIVAATYTVTITDSRSCSATGSRTITQPSAISIVPTVTSATCAVGNDGTITLSVTGGTGAYSYNWGGGITTPGRSGLTAGTYTVTVTDAVGCTAVLPVAVTQYGNGITLSSTATNITCNGLNNGAINITVSGGISPVTYNWNGGVTTEDRTGLAAGTYSVTVTDGAGCSAIASHTLTQPNDIAVTKNTTNVLCYGANTGSINITVSGGTGAYTYNWGSGITTEDRTGLMAGSYTVTITDANLCQATNTTIISQPSAALQATAATTAASCFGGDNGTINLTVTGGTSPYTFNWSNGASSQNISGVAAGTYYVTVTDAGNCSTSNTLVVSQPSAALVTDLVINDVLCFGTATGSVSQTVTGGTSPYSFVWNDGNTLQNRTGLTAGNYSVTVTDGNLCTTSVEFSVNQPSVINIVTAVTDVKCFGENNGTISAEVSGGTGASTYVWNTGSTNANLNGLIAGTYTITVTDANACTASAAATVTQPTALAVNINSGTSVCANATGTATVVTNNTGSAPYNYVWSNGGANSQNQNGLAPGPISVTVTDSHGCSITSSVTVGLSGNNTNAAYTYTGAPCGPNATISFNHTGSNNVSHFWDFGDGAGSSTFSAPAYTFAAAGSYQVTHIVTRGFCKDSVKQNVTILNKPAISAQNYNISCNGLTDGRIDLAVSSGSNPYTYNWGSGITTEDRTGLAPGTYTVTVTDATPCSAVYSATITQPAPLTITYTSTPLSCNGGTNGAITVNATGGTPGYAYNWNDANSNANRSNLTGGTYVVTVTDANLCSATNSIALYEPAAISIVTQVSHVLCNNQQNGSINVSASGGNGVYSYNWGNGITTANRTGLAAGNYSVTVSDANNCTGSATATVLQPATLSVALTATGVSCNGGSNGSISAITTGGTSPYAYQWNDNSTSENRYTVSAGSYTVTVSDINNCSATSLVTVSQPATAVSIQTAGVTHINCYEGSTGTINVTAAGGTPAYTFTWNDGSNLPNRTNLQAGNYSISVSDANGCQASVTTVLNQPAQALNIDTLVVSNVLCHGSATGAINTTVSGGTAPYSYNWSGGTTTANLTSAIAGNYQVTVTDNKGCSVSAAAAIAQPASALNATVAMVNPTCAANSNGSINITTNGGTIPYSYNWGNGITTEDRTNIPAGNYTVTITDANNCTLTKSATLTQPAALAISVSLSTNVSCYGGNNGSATTTTSGGTTPYSYLWNDNNTSANRTALTAGVYAVTVNDAAGCTATTAVTITQPASALAVSINSSANVSCYGGNNGSIATTTGGGTAPYNYAWSNGNNSANLTGITAGTYTLTVTDAKGCAATTSATISQPATALTVSVASSGNVSCAGGNNGSINVTATGGSSGYQYNWGGGITTPNRTGLAAGNYGVTVTDANQCTATANATLTQPQALQAAINKTDVACHAAETGTAGVTVSGGTPNFTYLWNTGATTRTIVNLRAGSYSVTITDANTCQLVKNTTIDQPAPLTISTVKTDVLCYNGSTGNINNTIAGGIQPYSYNWNTGTGAEDKTAVPAGTYTLTVTDANNCTASSSAVINQPAALALGISKTNPLCPESSNGAIDLSASGGVAPLHYIWSNAASTQDLTGIDTGSYSVLVTDSNGCTATASTTLAVLNPLTVAESHTNITCNGSNNGSITTQTTGGTQPYNYLWSNNATTGSLVGLTAGQYTLVVTDANGCTAGTGAITMVEPSLLGVGLTTSHVACAGALTGGVNSTVNGGTQPYTYLWSNNRQTEDLANIAAGAYTLTVTDANGCSLTANTFINTLPQLSVSAEANDLACYSPKGYIDLTVNAGTGPFTYQWNNGATTEDLANIYPGTYTVIVRDANNCALDTSFIIVNQNTFSVDATGGGTIKLGETIDLHVTGTGSQQTSFTWTPTFGMPCTTCADITVQPGHTTLYTVTGIDTNGCEAQDTVSVEVLEDHEIFTPNAFSPNGDGNNDYLQLFGNLAGIKTFELLVFDRWGEKVFETTEPTFTWDGTYKGEQLGPTVCVYVMNIVFLDGYREATRKGSLTLIR
jgi:gliding motility-associated-like protein